MVVGEVATHHDVVVLGSGPGGYTAALRCAEAGLDVAIIERERVGGVCLNVGCIPSKTLIHAADLAHQARQGGRFGIHATVTVDLAATRDAIDTIVGRLTKGVQQLLRTAQWTNSPALQPTRPTVFQTRPAA